MLRMPKFAFACLCFSGYFGGVDGQFFGQFVITLYRQCSSSSSSSLLPSSLRSSRVHCCYRGYDGPRTGGGYGGPRTGGSAHSDGRTGRHTSDHRRLPWLGGLPLSLGWRARAATGPATHRRQLNRRVNCRSQQLAGSCVKSMGQAVVIFRKIAANFRQKKLWVPKI